MKDLGLFSFFICTFVIHQVQGWNAENSSPSAEIPHRLSLSNVSERLNHSLPGMVGDHGQKKTVLTPVEDAQTTRKLQRNARDLIGNRMVNNRRPPPMPSSSFNRQNVPRGVSRPGVDPRGPGSHPRYRQAHTMPVGSTAQNSRTQPLVAHDSTLRNFNVMPPQRPQPSSYQLPPRQPQTLRKPMMPQLSASSSMVSQNQRNPSVAENSGPHNRLRNQKAPNRHVEVIHHIPVAMNPSDLKTGSSAVVYLTKPRHNIQTSQDMSMKSLPQNPLMSKNQGGINQGPSFMVGNQGLPPNAGNNLNQRVREINGLQSSSFIPSDSKSHQQNIQFPYPVPTTGIREQVMPPNLKGYRNTQIMGNPNKDSQPYFIRTANPNTHVKKEVFQSHAAPVRTIQNNTPQINRLKQELNAEIEELLKLVTQTPATPKLFPQQISHPTLIKPNQFNNNMESNKKEKFSSVPEDSRSSPDRVKIPIMNTNVGIQHQSPSSGTEGDISKQKLLTGMKPLKVPEPLSLNQRRPVVMESSVDSDELSEILDKIAYNEGSKLIHDVAKQKPVKLIISDHSENSKPDISASTVVEKLSHSGENKPFLKAGISSSENSHISSNEDFSVPLREELASSDTEDSTQINSNEFNNEKVSEAQQNLSKEKEVLQKPAAVKTYWNFHKENDKVSTSSPQITETETTKLEVVVQESGLSPHTTNNFQEQESVTLTTVKEEASLDEEMRKKHNHEQKSMKQNLGTLRDTKQTENQENRAPSHFIRYSPQRINSAETSVLSAPRVGDKITHKTTTASYEPEKLNDGANKDKTAFNKGLYFNDFPPKTTENKQRMNENLHLKSKESTESPKIPFLNRYTTARSFQRSTQRPTPQYIITKRPNPQSAVYGTRNGSRNRNRLTPNYIVSETPKIFSETPVLPENDPVISSEHVMTNIFRQVPANSMEKHSGFLQFPTDTTTTTQSNINSYKYQIKHTGNGEGHNFKSPDLFEDIFTTEIPKVTTYSSFELGIAESQLENAQEIENHAEEYKDSQASNTNVITNRQFFRGPQHSVSLDESSSENRDELTTYFIPPTSFENTDDQTTVENEPEKDSNPHYNEPGNLQYSVHSQTKVINALHLANKVFGRRNFTSYKQPISTTKAPIFKHKFTYAPVIKSSTIHPATQPETTTIGKRVVFNFRTGTTHSLPVRTSSTTPRVIFSSVNRNKSIQNTRNNTLEYASNVSQEDKNLISSSPPSVFHHVVFSVSNISSKYDQSAETESSKDLYGILKPITKPYNNSTLLTDEKDLIKVTTESYKNEVTSSTMMSTSVVPTLTTTTEDSRYSSSPSYTSPKTPNVYGRSKYALFSPFATIIPISFKNTSYEQSTDAATTMNSIGNESQTEAPSKIEDGKKGYHLRMSTTSTESPTEVATEPVDQEQIIVDSLKSMKFKMQDMASKGLRHLMPLVMDLSYDVSISSDCTFSLLRWLRAVKAMEQWAIRMMDASSKIPEGILYGTFSTFGSYDECIAIKTPKANLQLPYTGQYCSINIQPNLPPNERHFTIQNAFRKYPKLKQVFQEMNIEEDTMAYYYILKHRIGLCLPSTCNIDDLGNVTEKLADELKMKISVERCETSEKPSFTSGQIVSMCGVFIIFGVVILATIIDISLRIRTRHEMDIDEIIRKKNGIRQFSYVFSAFGNARKILDTSIPSTHLSSLHGIKFLSITWVMLGHVYYCKDYLTLAGLNKVRDLGSNLAFQVVLNSGFAADTFFFLSGLLVVYSTFLYLENNNGGFTIVGFYIRRYCRLTPAFLMISGVILLGPLAGSGPIWHETLEPFVSGCQNYWWTNLFYFSNFVPTDKTCVPHGWFLSCDMQFYIVAPIIILALYRRPRFGIFLISMGILSSMITTGLLTYLYKLPPVSLFSLPDPKDINEYLDTIGYKPYAHYASYCVGMATGFLLAAKQKISITKCLQIAGWVASVIGSCLVIYGTWNWNSGELPDWPVSVAYATTSRTIWSLGIAWLTVVCYAGHGGHVNTILSWRGFIPLSRLSYLAYLIHPLLMYLYASYVRAPFYFSQYVVVYLYLGHLCVTFGLAFLFSLAFEVPFLNLEKLVTKYLDKSKRKRRASFSHHHHNNWEHPELPELKDSVVLMRRRADKFLS